MRHSMAGSLRTGFILMCLLGAGAVPGRISGAESAPPLTVTHFFDWYTPDTPPEQCTHAIDWEAYGIQREEIGLSLNYYLVQFQMIRDTGFDGIVYEWYGLDPKPMVLDALGEAGLKIGMFYDLAIRFHGQPALAPGTASARRLVDDVKQFYAGISNDQRLRDSDGRLVMVFYAFPFDLGMDAPGPWEEFFRELASRLELGLGAPVRTYWTGLHCVQAMHGLLHHEEFSPLNFNPFEGQVQIDGAAVCWAFNYDDRGAVVQGRQDRLIQLEPAFLQEGYWLALNSRPELVFNYGWNEYFEGENIMPDRTFGDFRQRTMRAMLDSLKEAPAPETPSTLIVVDDLLPAWTASGEGRDPWIEQEFRLLYLMRVLFPTADVRVSGTFTLADMSAYDRFIGLNRFKTAVEDQWLSISAAEKKVIYLNPARRPATRMTQLFTAELRQQAFEAGGDPNEFAIVRREVDIDLEQFPWLSVRVRNTAGSVYHVRFEGRDAGGARHVAWTEESPLDDETTDGVWDDRELEVGTLADRAAGVDIVRIASIDLIVDDMENGDHHLDLDRLAFLPGPGGDPGWEDRFENLGVWDLSVSQSVLPDDVSWVRLEEAEGAFTRLGLIADDPKSIVVRTDFGGEEPVPIGDHVQVIVPLPEVRTLGVIEGEAGSVPGVLMRGDDAWINYYGPEADALWEIVLREWTGEAGNREGLYGLLHLVRMARYLEGGPIYRISQNRWSRVRPQALPLDPIPPMPVVGFDPRGVRAEAGSAVDVRWVCGGTDADGETIGFEFAMDPVVDGVPGGTFHPVEVRDRDAWGGGTAVLPPAAAGTYELWIRAVDDEGNRGFLQEPAVVELRGGPTSTLSLSQIR